VQGLNGTAELSSGQQVFASGKDGNNEPVQIFMLTSRADMAGSKLVAHGCGHLRLIGVTHPA